jgi:hypothetical protein
MATTLVAQLVLDALNMALATRRPKDVIHHSDQYTSIAFGQRRRQRRLGGDVEVIKPAAHMRPACVRINPGKEDGCSLKPFGAIQRVQLPPGKGAARQPEVSLAWASATSLVKRRQRIPKPWGEPRNHVHAGAFGVLGPGAASTRPPMARSRRSGRGLRTGQRCGMDRQET